MLDKRQKILSDFEEADNKFKELVTEYQLGKVFFDAFKKKLAHIHKQIVMVVGDADDPLRSMLGPLEVAYRMNNRMQRRTRNIGWRGQPPSM